MKMHHRYVGQKHTEKEGMRGLKKKWWAIFYGSDKHLLLGLLAQDARWSKAVFPKNLSNYCSTFTLSGSCQMVSVILIPQLEGVRRLGIFKVTITNAKG